jgi:hypothetical protein
LPYAPVLFCFKFDYFRTALISNKEAPLFCFNAIAAAIGITKLSTNKKKGFTQLEPVAGGSSLHEAIASPPLPAKLSPLLIQSLGA